MVDYLTTAEVVARGRKWGITSGKIHRWVDGGCLDKASPRGRGKDGGVARERHPDTLAKAVLIARSLDDDKEHDRKPSLKRAARALVGAGYLVRPDILRQLMLDELSAMQGAIRKHRQHFEKLSHKKARERYEESVERRYGGLPDHGIALLKYVTSTLAGHGRDTGPLASVNLRLDIESVKGRVESAPEEKLFGAIRGVVAMGTDPALWTLLAGMCAFFGMNTGPGATTVEAVLSAVPQTIGANTAAVSLNDCQQAATFILYVSPLLLVASETVESVMADALDAARKAGTVKPESLPPETVFLRALINYVEAS